MDTKTQLRQVAEGLVRQSGFNAMSFAQLAQEVGIKTASVHYHYPTKTALGVDLVECYHERFFRLLEEGTAGCDTARRRLHVYGSLFEQALAQDGGLCLCGVFASELPSLDGVLRAPVQRFFDENVEWLTRELRRGKARGELTLPRPASQVAASMFSALEGAMLVARTLENPRHLSDTLTFYLAALEA